MYKTLVGKNSGRQKLITRLKRTVSVIWILFNGTLGFAVLNLRVQFKRDWVHLVRCWKYLCSPQKQKHNYWSEYLSSGGNSWDVPTSSESHSSNCNLRIQLCAPQRYIFEFPRAQKGCRHLVKNQMIERTVPGKWQHSNLRPTHRYWSEPKRRRNRPVTRSVETLTPSSQTIDRGMNCFTIA